MFDDRFKLKFLRQYLTHAPDIMVRAPTKTGKGPYLPNLRTMEKKKVGIHIEGVEYLLSSVVAQDTLAQYLSFKGFTGQPRMMGLLGVVDEWLEKEEDKSEENLRAKLGDLVIFAGKYIY